jgi:hypothetical protein
MTQTVHFGPDGSDPGLNLGRGLAGLARARSGVIHLVHGWGFFPHRHRRCALPVPSRSPTTISRSVARSPPPHRYIRRG